MLWASPRVGSSSAQSWSAASTLGPRMHTLVTLGGQHQGIMSVPTCWSPGTGYAPSAACKTMQRLLGFGAYLPWVRDHIVQAQYFKVSRAGQ